jgi:hypothetical protein
MDNNGLLTLTRSIGLTLRDLAAKRSGSMNWDFAPGVVVMPESICSFCNKPIRSKAIWIFTTPPRFTTLVGAIRIGRNEKIKVVSPRHPHEMSHKNLCIGSYSTGMALLGGKANLNDCPMGVQALPAWYKEWWDHTCKESTEWIKNWRTRRREEIRAYNERNGYPQDRGLAAEGLLDPGEEDELEAEEGEE